jgi:hypothetical protein
MPFQVVQEVQRGHYCSEGKSAKGKERESGNL